MSSSSLSPVIALGSDYGQTGMASAAKRPTPASGDLPSENEGADSAHAALKPSGVSTAAVLASPPPAMSAEQVPSIVRGIITHYVDPEMRARLKEPADHLRLVEDLGLDSLTLMEIMIKVEDILQVTVGDDELRHFRTLGDVRQFIVRSVGETPLSLPMSLPV